MTCLIKLVNWTIGQSMFKRRFGIPILSTGIKNMFNVLKVLNIQAPLAPNFLASVCSSPTCLTDLCCTEILYLVNESDKKKINNKQHECLKCIIFNEYHPFLSQHWFSTFFRLNTLPIRLNAPLKMLSVLHTPFFF